MQSFSIRNIEILTGIKAHTLRIWELRFNFFKAQRKESRQRIYSNEDLKKLLCVSFLYHNGWKVSKIAALSAEEIEAQVRKTALTVSNYPAYTLQLMQAAVDFNEAAFIGVLNSLIDVIGFEKTVLDVCYPYLQRVGLLWNSNTIVPAQEHFSSYLIQNRVISATEKLSVLQTGEPEIVLFCPENEHHELPLLFLNYVLRKNGWTVLYLGANVTLPELNEAARLPGIRFLYLHFITNFTGLHVDDYFESLRKAFPDKILFASGNGVQKSERSFPGLHILKRDEEIYRVIEDFKTNKT